MTIKNPTGSRSPSIWNTTWITALACLATAVALAMVVGDFGGHFRDVLGLITILSTPGWAVVGFIPLRSPELKAALSIGVSVAAVMTAGQVMLWGGLWNVRGGVIGVLVAALIGCALQVLIPRRHQEDGFPDSGDPASVGSSAEG